MNVPVFDTYAHGKLLLTGEYFVLDGALALALPVRYGQHFQVMPAEKNLEWRSLEADGSRWFAATFALPGLNVLQSTDPDVAATLARLLSACRDQQPAFLADGPGYSVTVQADFPRQWGLGTSSTLLAALARWANADPYAALFSTLGGSGYDLACAFADGPLLYRLEKGRPTVQSVDFHPSFTDGLYFVYLGKKQDSRIGIAHYRKQAGENAALIERISSLSRACLTVSDLAAFEALLAEHEDIVSRAVDLPRVKTSLFPDFWGEVKSLGAWGGDFVLVTSGRSADETRAFFNEKGYPVFIPYADLAMPVANRSARISGSGRL